MSPVKMPARNKSVLEILLKVVVFVTHTDVVMPACLGALTLSGWGAMQVTQSRCYQAAISYWRRIKTEPDARTMGVLYWQVRASCKPPLVYATPMSVQSIQWQALHWVCLPWIQ